MSPRPLPWDRSSACIAVSAPAPAEVDAAPGLQWTLGLARGAGDVAAVLALEGGLVARRPAPSIHARSVPSSLATVSDSPWRMRDAGTCSGGRPAWRRRSSRSVSWYQTTSPGSKNSPGATREVLERGARDREAPRGEVQPHGAVDRQRERHGRGRRRRESASRSGGHQPASVSTSSFITTQYAPRAARRPAVDRRGEALRRRAVVDDDDLVRDVRSCCAAPRRSGAGARDVASSVGMTIESSTSSPGARRRPPARRPGGRAMLAAHRLDAAGGARGRPRSPRPPARRAARHAARGGRAGRRGAPPGTWAATGGSGAAGSATAVARRDAGVVQRADERGQRAGRQLGSAAQDDGDRRGVRSSAAVTAAAKPGAGGKPDDLDVALEASEQRLQADGGVVDDDDLVLGLRGELGERRKAAQRLLRCAVEDHDERRVSHCDHLPARAASGRAGRAADRRTRSPAAMKPSRS